MYPGDGRKAAVKMTDEMKVASLRQGSDHTRKREETRNLTCVICYDTAGVDR